MTNDETIETLTKITMKTGNLKIKLIQNINENYNSISMMIKEDTGTHSPIKESMWILKQSYIDLFWIFRVLQSHPVIVQM